MRIPLLGSTTRARWGKEEMNCKRIDGTSWAWSLSYLAARIPLRVGQVTDLTSTSSHVIFSLDRTTYIVSNRVNKQPNTTTKKYCQCVQLHDSPACTFQKNKSLASKRSSRCQRGRPRTDHKTQGRRASQKVMSSRLSYCIPISQKVSNRILFTVRYPITKSSISEKAALHLASSLWDNTTATLIHYYQWNLVDTTPSTHSRTPGLNACRHVDACGLIVALIAPPSQELRFTTTWCPLADTAFPHPTTYPTAFAVIRVIILWEAV